jgi:hypothetical protein
MLTSSTERPTCAAITRESKRGEEARSTEAPFQRKLLPMERMDFRVTVRLPLINWDNVEWSNPIEYAKARNEYRELVRLRRANSSRNTLRNRRAAEEFLRCGGISEPNANKANAVDKGAFEIKWGNFARFTLPS